jgi:uncharacterized protein
MVGMKALLSAFLALAAFLALGAVCASADAQMLPFHVAPNDALRTSASIRALAREALATRQRSGPHPDLYDEFQLQIAAADYAEAMKTFGLWRAQHPPRGFDRSILLELYAQTKVLEAQRHLSFASAFARAFAAIFAPLDDRTAADDEYFLETPVSLFSARTAQMLGPFKTKTSIAYPDALNLVRFYLAAEALRSFAPYLGAAVARDDPHRYTIEDVLIKTQGGAALSALIVRRRGQRDRQPTSLLFTIYVDSSGPYLAKIAAIHHYVGVVAYARGKRRSPDRIAPWNHEVEDTYGVIDWISRQPWSDGQVGMYGASYSGFAQWAAVKHMHPALKTIVPGSASFPGFGLPMQNNVFQYANYAWPFYVMDNRELDETTYDDNDRWTALRQKWYASGRPFREIDAIDGTPNPLLQEQLRHPSYDAYYQAMQPFAGDYAKINIPVLTMTGYYDDANAGAVRYFIEHYQYNPHANHYLLIGPYPHAASMSSRVPAVIEGYAIDPVAQIDSLELTYRWFDYVMRGGPRPSFLQDRVNFEVMGANLWGHAPSIEAMSNERLTLYLTDQKAGEQYRLSPRKPERLGDLEQTVDLADRRSELSLFPDSAIIDLPKIDSGFAFVSDPFDVPVSVAGIITGKLDLSINKRDLDVTLAVYELMPNGKLFWLAYYLGRASYAEDMSSRKLLTPGVRTWMPFTRTGLVARQLSKGSRLLVLLTVNKNSWAQVNYGTGKDVSDESMADAKEPLEVHWYNDSFVQVPISRASRQ